jgi:hypothetical protein
MVSRPHKSTRGRRLREERPALDHIGIDAHKRESQICILVTGGELIERRIRTEAERFAAVLGDRPRARIVIEASTDREGVARCLEALGHEVVVADPNFATMFGMAMSLNNLGRAVRFQGYNGRATTLCEESLQLSRDLGHTWGIARAFNSLGDVARAWSLGALGTLAAAQDALPGPRDAGRRGPRLRAAHGSGDDLGTRTGRRRERHARGRHRLIETKPAVLSRAHFPLTIGKPACVHAIIPPRTLTTIVWPRRASTLAATDDR